MNASDLLLAIETATTRVGVALVDAEGTVASTSVTKERRHAELLVPLVTELCRHAGVTPRDVAAVGVDVGPGLFTGLRVGIATAQGLALAMRIPLVAVSSLDAVAAPVRAAWPVEIPGVVVAALDARRGEVYATATRRGVNDAGEVDATVLAPVALTAEALVATEALASVVGHAPVVAVGDGALRYAPVLEASGITVADRSLGLPSPEAVGRLAWSALEAGGGIDPADVRPVYLRAPDAEINWTTRESA